MQLLNENEVQIISGGRTETVVPEQDPSTAMRNMEMLGSYAGTVAGAGFGFALCSPATAAAGAICAAVVSKAGDDIGKTLGRGVGQIYDLVYREFYPE
ncbi:hypothetical protein WAE56_18280 [Iodobacter sp. LRB]|uniref:hypothetical protein n=1 Tax=Iodobacter sp. LRB TaxID=3127955 RepID=UPI00307D05DF